MSKTVGIDIQEDGIRIHCKNAVLGKKHENFNQRSAWAKLAESLKLVVLESLPNIDQAGISVSIKDTPLEKTIIVSVDTSGAA